MTYISACTFLEKEALEFSHLLSSHIIKYFRYFTFYQESLILRGPLPLFSLLSRVDDSALETLKHYYIN